MEEEGRRRRRRRRRQRPAISEMDTVTVIPLEDPNEVRDRLTWRKSKFLGVENTIMVPNKSTNREK